MFKPSVPTTDKGQVAQTPITDYVALNSSTSSSSCQTPYHQGQNLSQVLVSVKAVVLTDCFAHAILTGHLGPENWPCELLILGNCQSRTDGFFVLPSILLVASQKEITVLALSPDPPCFIPLELTIAQAIILPKEDANDTSLGMWTQVINHDRPKITCTLELNNEMIVLTCGHGSRRDRYVTFQVSS